MRKLIFIFVVFIFSLSSGWAQWGIDLETGLTFQSYNDVRIPNETGTSFSFTDDFEKSNSIVPVRLRVNYTFGLRNHLSFLYAPLNIDYEGNPPFDIQFQQTLFKKEDKIFGFYKFNSYRLTYRRELIHSENWILGLGVTAKIRDAMVRLTTGTIRDRKTDLGFVPLVNIHLAYNAETWGILLEGDGLAGGPGRAFDFFLGGKYAIIDGFHVKAGYRFLEGGADVDEVYNFTLLHFAAIGAIWQF
nr:hypothetical protein [Saprospiraceae bacterium]